MPIPAFQPVVSVIVAAFQAHDFLRQAIASALAQTFERFEVIVSDDANDPAIERLVAGFADPRLVYRRNVRTLGPAGNHWAAFAVARGSYLAILNHDDLWRPGFLATLVPVLDQCPDVVLGFCDHEVIDPAGRPLAGDTDRTTRRWGRDRLAPGLHRPFPRLVAEQAIPVAMGALFRRDALDLATLPEVGPAYDLWLAYALCRTGGGAYYVPERLTAWRVHPSQLTGHNLESWKAGTLLCWQAMLQDPLFRCCRRLIRRKLAGSAVGLARSQLVRGHRAAARAGALLALRHQPTNWRAAALLGLSALPAPFVRPLVGAG
jgi:glycosyltransferase involved in cell wall biosynthesis